MLLKSNKVICFPHPPGAGGPGSFQSRFEEQLKVKDWIVSYYGDGKIPDLIFIVGGTRKFFWLLRMKLKKVPIVIRLDGISWLHKKKKVSLKKYFKIEIGNYVLNFIHSFIADKIIYQSRFVEMWWRNTSWRSVKNSSIIYNGVRIPDLTIVQKNKAKYNIKRLVILEGTVDYSPYAVQLLNDLSEQLPNDIKIEVYGNFENKNLISQLSKRLEYHGVISRNKVPEILLGSVYLSLDINPACPNTVIEAMASGAPVVGFDTGALPELVKEQSGLLVPYGSNPWNLNYPDINSLVKAILNVFDDYTSYSLKAFGNAKRNFGINLMTMRYLNELNKLINVR